MDFDSQRILFELGEECSRIADILPNRYVSSVHLADVVSIERSLTAWAFSRSNSLVRSLASRSASARRIVCWSLLSSLVKSVNGSTCWFACGAKVTPGMNRAMVVCEIVVNRVGCDG